MPHTRASRSVLLRTAGLAGIIALLGWFGFRESASARREELRASLQSALATARLGMLTWAGHELAEARAFARSPAVVDAARTLDALPRTRAALEASQASRDLERVALALDRTRGRRGWILFDRAGLVLASSDGERLGEPAAGFEDSTVMESLAIGHSALGLTTADSTAPPAAEPGRLLAAAPLHDAGGRPFAVFALRLDPRAGITGLAGAGGAAPDHVFAYDREGRIVGAGPAAARAFGANRPDGFDLSGHAAEGGGTAIGGWTWVPELGLGLATELDRAQAFGFLRLTALGLAALGLVGFVLVAGAMTSMRQARELVSLVDDAPIGMLLVDHAGVIRRANPEAARTFGYPRGLVGVPVDALVPDAARTSHRHLREGFHRDPRTRPMGTGRHLQGVRQDGRQVDVEVALSPVTMAGRPYVLTMLWDIGPRRAMEQALQERTAELARSNHDLEQFAYVASHDLRAPLRGISQLCQWIVADLPPDSGPDARRYLELVRGRVNRLDAMLTAILEYARASREAAAPETVDTRALVRELVALQHWPEGFQLAVHGALPVLETDANALQQVFLNLLGNAIKHHDRGAGTIEIAASDGEPPEFRVSDDGPGIPAHLREKAFEMFQTLRPRDEVEGSGMGLALVRRIVERRGGAVTIEDHVPRGTTVRFTWPQDDSRRPRT